MSSPVEDLAAVQAAEYAAFVATQTIWVGGARAYNIGDPVPASNVKTHGYLQLGVVREVDTSVPPVSPSDPQVDPVTINDTTN